MSYTKLDRILSCALRIDSDLMRRKLIVLVEQSEGSAYGLIQTLFLKRGAITEEVNSAIAIEYTKNDSDSGFSYMVYAESDAPKTAVNCPVNILTRLTAPQTAEARIWRDQCLSQLDWQEARNVLKENPSLLATSRIAQNTESHRIRSRF
jgi:hypothetical protein